MKSRLAVLLAGLSLACWLCAWFLPVIEGYSGWGAFYATLQGPFREQFPTSGEDSIPQILSTLTNVVFIVLWLNWLADQVTRPALFAKIALACLLLNLYWLMQFLRAGWWRDLLAGYYVWLAAFALLLALGVLSVVSARRTSKTPTAGTPA